MDFGQKLSIYKKSFDKKAAHVIKKEVLDVAKKDELSAKVLEYCGTVMLSGGKRVRPFLTHTSYVGCGGRELNKILNVEIAVELVHIFLLIHDDFMDDADERHGVNSVHKKFSIKGDKHFGDSLAVTGADLIFALANRLALESGLESEKLLKAVAYLQSIVENTAVGQIQDISLSKTNAPCQEDVLKMYQNKTAKYTFEGPLMLGATLAGCTNKKTLKEISDFSLVLGRAFQIQDDILGVFGTKAQTGKTVNDIAEGKRTLLVVSALKNLNSRAKRELQSILGKKDASKIEIARFKALLEESGSLEYCKKMISDDLNAARRIAQKLSFEKQSKENILGLIEYLEKRKY